MGFSNCDRALIESNQSLRDFVTREIVRLQNEGYMEKGTIDYIQSYYGAQENTFREFIIEASINGVMRKHHDYERLDFHKYPDIIGPWEQ